MSAVSVYSNHAGTMSESFAIGKRGVKLLQGTVEPTGLVAPTGSLYILRGDLSNRVYQIDAVGIWTPLLYPTDIIAGTGVGVDYSNGTVTVSRTSTKYKQTFTNATLSSGILTVTHNLDEDFPLIQIYNNSRQTIIPDSVASVSANQVVIGLQSYGTLTGDWTIAVQSE